ncbi:NAD(P)-dependent glycerol-3-phosphate dehydrogenase [Francisella tularensis subsp. novicida]|uniref:Glycerol-3-phosphate dehydrogenase [NAD(P)+] n=2 Tax=Francisella tularensis TaxID=263 RepID=GPDA_FRATN|nr:NAD(P)H-dependent glycerol-3-phosphate dehydrogenase [Francisella tularensis]A0Q4Y5.1 RecName: Full=Glycerol-3-phosphate dehydrogenase [NAD(P)+]; AltName: Full=NAD(P)H-dependent glycerol-3-phosphate dehydrogenase [Francisella tularensis subsp. novicida U112]ABK89300.1 glycerol-3-phosphate-dehydrogenase-(NAD+) [Francisella tularensis subsp. novicida U112]AJI61612.1 ketopantoate reductase PanE/ApbA family protein [Francisella tularensis subsp. novicida U112]EDX19170.1 NAD-dependent glycerol-3-
MQKNILVLGAGAWGTALALQLAYRGHNVRINSWKAEHNEQMLKDNNNHKYLPSIEKFPSRLKAIQDWQANISEFDNILVATPSSGFKNTILELKEYILPQQNIISATKGFCHDSYALLSEIAEDILPTTKFALLTGPSFAKELANQLPTAVVVASKDIAYARYVQELFSNENFRCYTTTDIIGAQVGGAVKNVLAITAGIAAGMEFGVNAHAALITRGLAEIKKLGLKLGANSETFIGLSCLGDLLLTCSDNQSRNRRFGLYLGQGMTIQQALKEVNNVVEGYFTAKAVYNLAKKHNVEMPLVFATYRILYEAADPRDIVKELMTRQLKNEN